MFFYNATRLNDSLSIALLRAAACSIFKLGQDEGSAMTFSKFGRIALASVVSLGLGFGAIACGPSNTIDFVYVTSSKQNPGGDQRLQGRQSSGCVDSHSQLAPTPQGGANPVADITSPNGKNLYVVNHDSNARS